MIDKVLKFADEHEMLPESGCVLVCVSGGADSMCLLEVMRHISYERGFSVAAAHFNHGMRGEESDRDESFVHDYCDACGVPLYSGDGDVRAYANARNLSIEMAARELRYDFFNEAAEIADASRIATAHTADDNAETILMNLVRGAGAAGLSGIPPLREAFGRDETPEQGIGIIRPMLRISRDEVMKFIGERGIPFIEDPTNSLDIYTRNKIRNTVMPVLREINPRLNEAAAAAAELLRADEEMLSDLADLFITDMCSGLTAEVVDLLNLPFAVSSRVVRKLYGGNLSYNHVKAVLELCEGDNPSASLSLPGMTVFREYGRIVFASTVASEADGFAHVYPADGDSVIIFGAGLKMTCKSVVCDDNILKFAEYATGSKINKSFTSFLFKTVDICGKIAVRPRREGDTIRLFSHTGTKTLKKLFIERRVPTRKRALIPVIADDYGVLGVYGLGFGERAIPAPGDAAIQIVFEEIQPKE